MGHEGKLMGRPVPALVNWLAEDSHPPSDR